MNSPPHRSADWGARVKRGLGPRIALRRLRLGLSTLLGSGQGGWFIPYARAGQSQAPSNYPPIEAVFAARHDEMRSRLDDIETLAPDLMAIERDAPAPEPRWNQDWFPWLDGAMTYAMARRLKPGLWLEIGSGHSTRFVARAIRDGNLKTRLVAIDPRPRAALKGLAVEWHETLAQEADASIYRALKPGDVLFVDSSHVLMPGSDVDFVINRLLPDVPAGLNLHVHDVFLPDGYPGDWTWRGYNEQNAIGALVGGGGWEVLGASHYMATRLQDRVMAGIMGRLAPSPGPVSSLWLRKRVAVP